MDTYRFQLQMSGGHQRVGIVFEGLANLSLCMTKPKVAIIFARFCCCVAPIWIFMACSSIDEYSID